MKDRFLCQFLDEYGNWKTDCAFDYAHSAMNYASRIVIHLFDYKKETARVYDQETAKVIFYVDSRGILYG